MNEINERSVFTYEKKKNKKKTSQKESSLCIFRKLKNANLSVLEKSLGYHVLPCCVLKAMLDSRSLFISKIYRLQRLVITRYADLFRFHSWNYVLSLSLSLTPTLSISLTHTSFISISISLDVFGVDVSLFVRRYAIHTDAHMYSHKYVLKYVHTYVLYERHRSLEAQ